MGRVLLMLAMLAVLVGCARAPADALTQWTLLVPAAPPRDVTLPAHLEVPNQATTYELRATVPIAPELRGRELALVMPYFAGKTAVRVGGETAAPFEPTPRYAYRGTGAQAWRIPATDRTEIAVVIEVDHRWTQSAWVGCPPELMPEASARQSLALRSLAHAGGALAALATLLTIGFTYFVIFLLDRRRASHGWFALGMMSAAYYPLFNLGWSQAFLGVYDVPVLGLALVLATIATVYYAHAEFDLGRPPRLFWMLGVVALGGAAVAHEPFDCTRVLGTITIGVVIVIVAYNVRVLARLVRRRPPPTNAVTLLLCWLLLSATIWNDLAAWLGLGEPLGGVRLGGWGLAVFALLQSVSISRAHILSHLRADRLNVELGQRVDLLEAQKREIQLLNDELRRQIAERSRDLSRAVARIGRPAQKRALAEGQVVGDIYRLVRPIGSGGMGTVYEVVRETDARSFAMKIMKKAPDRVAIARFAREAEIVARVDHPNVIAIHDVGVSREDLFYLVMELALGTSLAERQGPRDVRWTLDVVAQVASGLAAIHAHGFVHRDVKPANILLRAADDGARPIVKITDFGIAGLAHDVDEIEMLEPPSSGARAESARGITITRTGVLLGTPPYLAPELTRGIKVATPAADVFGVGVIAYELLVGERPFREPPFQAAMRGAFRPATPLATIVPDLPADVAALLDLCLALDPAKRPAAAHLAASLAAPGSDQAAV